MPTLPDTQTLQPKVCGSCRVFQSTATDLVRLDLLFEAGSAYQPQPLCASAANKLCTVATRHMDADALSEFMDYRGVIVETGNEVLQSTITIYMLRRYIDEVLPVVADMLHCPAFAEADFRTWQARKRQEILAGEQRSSVQARRLFYEALFGADHPLGRHATADDVDRLDIDTVRSYFDSRYTHPTRIVLAGNVDDMMAEALNSQWSEENGELRMENGKLKAEIGEQNCRNRTTFNIQLPTINSQLSTNFHFPLSTFHFPLPTTQTTLRIGRVVPLEWHSLDYARLMIAVTALGGYFGSRLMSNLREDKGFTYGIYARTQIYRGVIVFYITADVAGGTAKVAVDEVLSELQRMCDEPVPEEELQLVKTVLTGDFLRSVDGVFERAARYTDMVGTDVDERFTDNLRVALQTTTSADIQRISALCLDPRSMVVCTAGAPLS